MNIALIGCGAISSSILQLLKSYPTITVRWLVLPRFDEQSKKFAEKNAPQATPVLSLAKNDYPDLLVECAGHKAILQHVLPALKRGINVVVASIGALSSGDTLQLLIQAGINNNAKIYLPSGAIGGIDALVAAKIGGLDKVIYNGSKPPLAWINTPAENLCDLMNLKQPYCFFSGTARDAAQLYPKNANVAATLALSTLGMDQTLVNLYADPNITQNVHHIEACGTFGNMDVTMRGNPLADNPKTSALTVYSLLRTIVNQNETLVI